MSPKYISIRKAKVHNLKSIDIDIPKNTFTVISGPSGSGKSSLAFDTIYVEGQRRYVESLSSYARQFLGQYSPPDVESINGLSPTIAIEQKNNSRNPRSTVGTITEVYDYMRVLFARVGTLYCPDSGKEIRKFSASTIVKELIKKDDRTKIQLLAPVIKESSKSIESEVSKFLSLGFTRARINGKIQTLDDTLSFEKDKKYTIELIIDRIIIKKGVEKRLTDSVEYALETGKGVIYCLEGDGNKETIFSEKNMSPITQKIYPDLEPPLFSFNSPLGACPKCNGLGETKLFDKKLMIFDDNLSIMDGAITPLAKKNSFFYRMTVNMAEQEKINLNTPLKELPNKFLDILFNGTNKKYQFSFKSEHSSFEFKKHYSGILEWLNKKYLDTESEKVRRELEKYMNIQVCPDCKGQRLNQVAINTRIEGKNISEVCQLSISETRSFFKGIKFEKEKKVIAKNLLKQILDRLDFLINVGLEYLQLSRRSATLSGGEGQRIRLATQIGSALSGILYVLDEPSIGLHQRDNKRLINTLHSLRELGNTILVVEHDEETIRHADYLIDLGPKAGIHGGEIIAHGKLDKVLKQNKSLTAKYINGDKVIETPMERKKMSKKIILKGANHNNLKKLNIEIPLEGLLCISGVSGSGKSTLIHDVLVPAIKAYLAKPHHKSLYDRNNYKSISGVHHINSIINLDQTAIGRTHQSNPATYTGIFDNIRTLFSQTNESKIRGYKPGRFSFNVKGGRCEECEGNGVKKIEMHFMPDIHVTCNECLGTRYNKETLSILYKGKNIAQILKLTVSEAISFFKNHPKMSRVLNTLNEVGLGYLELGQPATTLSGGEAQRIKLSKELSKRTSGHCLYVLDEPTTGLHFDDIKILLNAIHKLIDKGNSVVIIEHNMDVIKNADYIIDLGPEGGNNGGKIVIQGTPEEIVKNKNSHTAKFLKKHLKK